MFTEREYIVILCGLSGIQGRFMCDDFEDSAEEDCESLFEEIEDLQRKIRGKYFELRNRPKKKEEE